MNMNADWGRPSPLDVLRDQSGYFPDLSRYDDAQSLCTYQEEYEHKSNVTRNQSMLSFETVQTNQRLLDKLDLSVEDEALLHQALREEEENSRIQELREQQNGPIICMPASKFPSLRMKGVISSKDPASNMKKRVIPGLSLKGHISSSAVEQHYVAQSRFSYLAEEDSDTELGTEAFAALSLSGNERGREWHPKIVNFESYRIENSNLLNRYPQFFSDERLEGQYDSQPLVSSSEPFAQSNYIVSPSADRLYQSGSGNSTKTSFVEPGQLSKPKTQSSMESNSSFISHARTKEKSQDIRNDTPTKSISSPSIDLVFFKEVSKEPPPSYKAHKKKSSFSLRNLFKSPISSKSRGSLDTREGADEINSPQSSDEGSPKKRSQQLRKFILPANPVLQFEPQTPKTPQTPPSSSKQIKRKAHHFRSLSDFHKVPSPVSRLEIHSTDKFDSCRNSPLVKSRPRRKLSLDSRTPAVPVSSFNTRPHSSQQSRNHLQFYGHRVDGCSHDIKFQHDFKQSSDSQIRAAIEMRNGGQLEESASRLRKACQAHDKTAFLLYGLALRYGSGVPRDYKESFRHIKAAAGVSSEAEDIFKCDINPFQLESSGNIPKVAPEPIAPALYECGIAYLKGYGPDHPNELHGLKYLEKAASLGHIDSMCLSATIWSKKSATRKKDIARAACWFRLAEKRGANLIGSQWIHKEKYKS
ncbi:hypothetical protein HG536_0G02990 [Torulaspora globosa]|uniref:Protein DSF2 n=1 Tax=Torulaspora globosa TaxID=48254 RepID=A0A7G3ZLQ1_9SACH|nr:uncharacterized protein HG536_0G02990 [Torulaspora globosa]QLL34437.1 hypothetical protein HG536_0G02990 [Torulaspora globosa]